ncbi:restriction endonuclease [Streptomyces sp. NPDC006544]|uniref:restriction endonuclease n=1 Tax=Streptomyces sp. NPDC006544 TaxID=3154583 RepID=UPI0033BEC4A4
MSRSKGPHRGAPLGGDVLLAFGLAGTAVAGLAAFVRAAGDAGTRIPVLPVVTVVVLLLGVVLARWSVSPVRRRSAARPDAYGYAAPAGPGLFEAPGTAFPPGTGCIPDTLRIPDTIRVPDTDHVPDPGLVPDVGATALDHAAVDADGFEHTVAALCARDGCSPVEVVGGAGDLGADVLATTPDGLRVVLQCKHYAEDNRVGSQDLQRFGGTCFAVHDADVAIIVTTSSFTAPALDYAATCGIVCLDGEALAEWTEQAVPPPWEAPEVRSEAAHDVPRALGSEAR